MPDESTPKEDASDAEGATPSAEALPDEASLSARERLDLWRTTAGFLSPGVLFNVITGDMVKCDIYAEVAASKAREGGTVEILALAEQLQTLITAANRIAMRGEAIAFSRPFPLVQASTDEDERKAREQLAKAAERYLWVLLQGTAPKPISKEEESRYLVRLIREALAAIGDGQLPEAYARAAFGAIGGYMAPMVDRNRLIPLSIPPIAKVLLELTIPPEETIQKAIHSVSVVIASAQTGPTSEEAARRAACNIMQALGVPAKTANNWFRVSE